VDLVPENVLVQGTRLRVIDFDDAGFGWHMFELATSLYFLRRKYTYEMARDALIAGHRRLRPLGEDHLRTLPMFLAARGTTYLAWPQSRKGEAAAQGRAPELIELATEAAAD
jgi:Ser/Thr protein kinase RdoA (MazF antagonist)